MLPSLSIVALMAASSVLSRPNPRSINIPLHKRGQPLSVNGVVYPKALANEMYRIEGKYGWPRTEKLGRRQGAPSCTINQENGYSLSWKSDVTIGSPEQKFPIAIDTGLSDFWVPDKSCSMPTCETHSGYDSTKSTTSKLQNGTFSISYGNGSCASGSLRSDNIGLGGLVDVNQTFGVATNIADVFGYQPVDGILGLGWPSLSKIDPNSPSFLQRAAEQGKIDHPMFTLSSNETNSELTFGSRVPDQCKDSFICTPVTKEAHWQFEGELKRSLIPPLPALSYYKGPIIADSGAKIIVGPKLIVSPLILALGAIPCSSLDCGLAPITSGFWQMACNKVPAMNLVISGFTMTIPANDLILGKLSSNPSQCVLALASSSAADQMGAFIMGDVAMKSACIRFDMQQGQVCFANRA